MNKELWRIGISGSHCSGKSTLASSLTRALRDDGANVELRPEPIDVLRPLLSKQKPPLTSDHIYYLLLGEHLRRLEQSANQYIIYDRTLLDYAAYLKIEGPKNSQLKNAIDQLLPWYLGHFDFVFFLPTEIPLELDGNRPSSEKHRTDIEDAIIKTARDFDIELIELRGSVEERTDFAIQTIEQLTRDKVH
ncbi:MAG: ATP-binding protein [Porticoccaceae bacterium]